MVNYNCIIDLPGFFFVKDSKSHFVAMSNYLAKSLGWKNFEHAIDKTDFDIPSCYSENAPFFVLGDNKIFKNKKPLKTLDTIYSNGEFKMVIGNREPIINEQGNVPGLFYHGIDITETNLFPWTKILNSNTQKIFPSGSYIIGDNHFHTNLSKQQQLCVFLLIRGQKTKSIANILDISPRTVESYIDIIKHKFKVYSITQIIEKALNQGFAYYIPTEIFNTCKNTKTI